MVASDVSCCGVAVCAIAVSSTLAWREFGGGRPLAPAPAPQRRPTYTKGWEEVATSGIRTGRIDAKIQIVEFADFECPFCKRFNSQLRLLTARFPDQISVVFVHFPISGHRFALAAGRAAECALAQGRFAQMRDALYDKQDSLGLKSWTSYALAAGVTDTSSVARCAAAANRVERIERGLALGSKFGVRGTPTVIVNGWNFQGPPPDTEVGAPGRAAFGGPPPFRSEHKAE